MALDVPAALSRQIDEIITHYPPEQKPAPVLWLLHLLQEQYGSLGQEQVEWTAARLGIPAIDVWGLVSFYPMFTEKPRGRYHLKVCRTLSCEMGGCQGVLQAIQKRLGIVPEQTTPDGKFTLSTFECLADCGNGPVMMVNDEHFANLTPEKTTALLDHIAQSGLEEQPLPPLRPAHPAEKRLVMANLSQPGYDGSLANYQAAGGYEALRKAVGMPPEAIVQEVIDSKLRGRGGAGFPTGTKWKFIDKKSGKPIYLVCNCDESEPGTFKDRVLIHRDPHLLLEGIAITCFALGAKVGYIYIRGEFPKAVAIVQKAIDEARAASLLGKKILGVEGFDCEIYLHRGAGAYICGEETGLIESLEGKRAYPRIKPPFPAISGLFNCPTVVNNVETLCNIPQIITHGGAWFAGMGVPGSSGTRLVCVSGAVVKPGYFEFEMGKLTLRQLLFEVCGGLREGRTLKGVIPGGSSMPIMTPEQLDVTLDFDAIQKAGSMAGSGGIIVLDDTTQIIDAALNIAKFYAHESCGQCTPCREGTLWMEKMLHRIKEGQGRPEDVDLLWDVADNIEAKTICALGTAAAWPVKAFTTKYKAELAQVIASGEGKQ
ncbi:MAG: NADH-quinone oxidoreductase subunit NuoF [Candidatus Handelsmanbacteria bacterium]|nr:NADH-quinone oxidoreductase subunit NuoF [Candidatus Handelsmanbacteria bacterium]